MLTLLQPHSHLGAMKKFGSGLKQQSQRSTITELTRSFLCDGVYGVSIEVVSFPYLISGSQV